MGVGSLPRLVGGHGGESGWMLRVKVMSVDRGKVLYLWAKGETADRSGSGEGGCAPGGGARGTGLELVIGLQWFGKAAICWAELEEVGSEVEGREEPTCCRFS